MPLSGPEKAALMMLALDESTAAEVMRRLSEADIRRLAAATESLAKNTVEQSDEVYGEFQKRLDEGMMAREGSEFLRTIAAEAFGEERARRLLAPASTWTEPLEYLRNVRPNLLADQLEEEHPQLASVLLAQLPRSQAAKVLKASSAEQQIDLLRRLGELKEIPLDAVKAASEAMAQTLTNASGIADVDAVEFDGVGFSADILNELSPVDAERLLVKLDMEAPEMVVEIRKAMFGFEDLIRLPKRAMITLMREVQADDLVIALKTASEALQEHFCQSMSTRAVEALKEDMAVMPPLRLSEVEKMQAKIVEAALRLKAEGAIEIPGQTGDKLV